MCLKIITMDKLAIIKRPVQDELEELKVLFDGSLTSGTPLLNQVLGYIKKRNGKMMRPLLVLLMAKVYGRVTQATYHGALALELLHTASLVHDDVVDESDKRRGQQAVHVVFDNKVAVLVGDYMLSTCLKHSAATGQVGMVDLVARLGQDLSEGEIIQLANTNNTDFSEAIYFDVIRKKTAALFIASAQMGALSVGASAEEVRKAALFGELIGIAFQIKDDIFDYFDSPGLGKPTGNDMLEGKLTLPALYVLNHHPDEGMKELALRIRRLEATPDEIAEFVDYVKVHDGIAYAEQVMYDYRNRALEVLPEVMDATLRSALEAYIDFVIEREK